MQKLRRAARQRRTQGNQILRQIEVEFVDAHRALFNGNPPGLAAERMKTECTCGEKPKRPLPIVILGRRPGIHAAKVSHCFGAGLPRCRLGMDPRGQGPEDDELERQEASEGSADLTDQRQRAWW
ncbi:hypothetical protein GCM10011335_47900 [Aureimonas glaciei]|uniref:Uncharacterized protein n=1 Tax=Aureimonas glaciei TaxID=1776957 RepID=A0A917DGX9_9HYPH|nr:hypothetical protein GCM10011335_47900 [Aureimonas glaciei]